MRLAEKKRSTAEKNIGMDVLRKYFSGSLKDAAKSLGGEPLHPSVSLCHVTFRLNRFCVVISRFCK